MKLCDFLRPVDGYTNVQIFSDGNEVFHDREKELYILYGIGSAPFLTQEVKSVQVHNEMLIINLQFMP